MRSCISTGELLFVYLQIKRFDSVDHYCDKWTLTCDNYEKQDNVLDQQRQH